MIYIAHRGNVTGKSKDENHPSYLDVALKLGYSIECDVWFENNDFVLGHDAPMYTTSIELFRDPKVWTHCKNVEALSRLIRIPEVNCFWHQKDAYTLTSKGYIWVYPRSEMPWAGIQVGGDEISSKAIGICSDKVSYFR